MDSITLSASLGLNLVLLAALFVFGVPRAQTALMLRNSGKDYNKEYAPKRGRKNSLQIPALEIIGRKSQPRWPTDHAWLEPLWRHWIGGVRQFGRAHMLAIAAATGIAVAPCCAGNDCGSGQFFECATFSLATALALITLLYFFTRVRPRLGRGLRSDSYLLSAGVLILWVFWAVSIDSLPGEEGYLPWLGYLLAWFMLLAAPAILRTLRWRDMLKLRMNLLVLRVFGSYRRSLFIFKVLQPLWNQVGGVFTVSSPDQGFSGFKAMSKFRLLVFLVLWLLLVIAQAWALDLAMGSQPLQWTLVVGLPFIAHALLYLRPLAWVVDSSFMKDESDTYTPIVKNINKRNLLGVHKNTHVACHADDWKLAVESFASMSDCLLIDLRGFTAANAGLAYELGFVVNNIPLENVLGLADKTTDMQAVKKCFADQWRHMLKKSVNHHAGKRSFQIYQRDRIRSRDAFHIAAWLLSKSIRRDLLGDAQKEVEAEFWKAMAGMIEKENGKS